MEAEIITKELKYEYTTKTGKTSYHNMFINVCSVCNKSIHKITYNEKSKTKTKYPIFCYWCGSRLINNLTFGGDYDKNRRK